MVVIGGDAAGMSAASRVRKRLPHSSVVVYEAGNYVSYSACGMPFHIGGIVKDFNSLLHYTVDKFEKERDIEIRLNSRVISIDTARHAVVFQNSRGEGNDNYDRLIIATGAKPRIPEKLHDVKGLHTLRTLNDLPRLESSAEKASHVTIVGAGYIGLELAEAFRLKGKDVRIIQRSENILRGYDTVLSEKVTAEVMANGVTIDFGTEVESAAENGNGFHVLTSSGEKFDTGMLVVATGVGPNSELAAGAGIRLGVSGAIQVDEYMRTSAEDVFAAGDAATTFNRITGRSIYMPLATGSNRSGRVAGENAAGGHVRYTGITGTEVVKVFSLEAGRTGIGEKEAVQAGFTPVSALITSTSRSSYYPGSTPLSVKLTADRQTRRLLGGAIIGNEGVAKRIDVVAAALAASMTADEMTGIDYSYSPPFGPAWEPLGVAADVLAGKLG